MAPGRPVHGLARNDREIIRTEFIHKEHQVPAGPSGARRNDPIKPEKVRRVGDLLSAGVIQGRKDVWRHAQRGDLIQIRQLERPARLNPDLVQDRLNPGGKDRLAAEVEMDFLQGAFPSHRTV